MAATVGVLVLPLLCSTGASIVWGATPAGVELRVESIGPNQRRQLVSDALGRINLDAGEVDPIGVRRPRSGTFVRWERGGGAFVVWTLRATVRHGDESVRLGVDVRPGPASGRLRFAMGEGNRWRRPDEGRPFSELGETVLHPAVVDGQAVVFQLALVLRDGERSGPLSTVVECAVASNGTRLTPRPTVGAPARLRELVPLQRRWGPGGPYLPTPARQAPAF